MTNTPYTIDGDGNYTFRKPVHKEELIDIALTIIERSMDRGTALSDPHATRQYLSLNLGALDHEVFCCLFLDNQHRIISFDRMFNGTIDGTAVYPREIVKSALKYNAAAVILTHNHPSGVAEPSNADQSITIKIREALSLVDVRVLDHLVVGGTHITSFAERGLL